MDYDLSNIYIKFQECPAGKKLVEHFSELGAFKEFTDCDDDRIKVAILSGDVDSPFVRIKERDVMMRSIFEFLNINLKGKQNQLLFENIVAYRDDRYMFAWVKYLEILNETDFTNWVLAKKAYNFYLFKSNDPQRKDEEGNVIEDDIKYMKRYKEAREELISLGEELKVLEAKLFPDSKAAREAKISQEKKKILLLAEKYGQEYNYY